MPTQSSQPREWHTRRHGTRRHGLESEPPARLKADSGRASQGSGAALPRKLLRRARVLPACPSPPLPPSPLLQPRRATLLAGMMLIEFTVNEMRRQQNSGGGGGGGGAPPKNNEMAR